MQFVKGQEHVRLTRGVMNLIKLQGDDVITIYSEETIKDPRKEMKRLCRFLSLSCSEDYLKDCASIVNGTPSKSRNTIVWRDRTKSMLTDLISKTPMLQRYRFDGDWKRSQEAFARTGMKYGILASQREGQVNILCDFSGFINCPWHF